MMDPKTLAYINMYAILGSLQELCALSDEAGGLIAGQGPVTLVMEVREGPAMTFTFAGGRCETRVGAGPCDVKLPFSSCEKFNGLIEGTVTPFPSKGFTKIGFLTKVFTPLTDILTKYLRATPEALADEAFFTTSTTLMLNVVTVALAQIGNQDKIGRFTASNMKDGRVCLSVKDGPAACIDVRDHQLTAIKERPESFTSLMEFKDLRLARQLFDGAVSAMACIGRGDIEIRGYIANIDNINRLLDRVALYIA